MAERIKKSFFKILPLSVVILLVIAVGAGLLNFLPNVQPAKAVAGDGASSAIWLLDSNLNGKIDRITFSIANPNGETWVLNGTSPYGLSVTQAGNAITISTVTITSLATANPVTIRVDLDETDTDLLVNTDGVVTGAMELIYTQSGAFGTPPNINDSTDEQLNAIATGDTGATDTEVDKSAPYLVSATYSDSNHDSKVDRVGFTFSEITTVTTITAADWAFSTAGDINLTGDFAAAECVGSGASVNFVCTDAGTGTVDADADKTGKQTTGGTEPAFTYTNNTNNINDGAAGNNTATFGPRSLIDGATPMPLTRVTKDTNSLSGAAGTADGDLDGVLITFTEAMDASSVAVTDFIITLNDDTVKTSAYGDTIDDTTLFFGLSNPTPNDTYNLLKTRLTGGDGILELAGNLAGNEVIATAATDGAAPVIVTISPTNGASEVAVAASVVVTFSEPMTTGSVTYTLLPNPGGLAVGWTVGDTVATYTHTAFDTATLYTYTATAGASAAAGDPDLSAGPIANPFSFTTLVVGGGGGGTTAIPDSLTVTAPNGGESWAGNSSHNIVWTSTGSNVSKVKLLYSLDSGINFSHAIATNENNDGSYSWTVPNVATSTAKVKIEGYDSSGVLVTSDISDANFTITYVTPTPGTPETPTTPTTPETPLNELQTGDLLKSPLSTTVYYYGSDQKRHIFPNEKTYKSWYADFASVKSVSAETLQAIPLGNNVTVRAGTFLVKIQTDPKVYAVEPNGLLRWVPTEARAIALYGSAWATKVIDVPVIFWVDYTFGTDITTDQHPTGALVKYASSADVYYVQNAQKRKVSSAGFTANHFQDAFVLTIPTTISYVAGTDVATAENAIERIY